MWGVIQTTHTTFIIIWGESSYLETCSPLSLITTPLLWDINGIYGATKEFHWYLGVVGTTKLDDFILGVESFIIFKKNKTINVIQNRCVIPNHSHPWWHRKVCSTIWKGLSIDDYHEFRRAHEVHIEEWWLYCSSNKCLSLKYIWSQHLLLL